MIEPSYHYVTGSYSVADRSGDFTGKVGGLNLGYMGEFFMAGLALEKGDYEYDSTITESGYTQFTGGGVGTYIAFHFYDRIRLWTGYLNSTLEPKDNDDFRYFGQHISVGLGLRVVDGFLINFTDFRNHFTQIEDDTTGKTTGLTNNIKTSGQSWSISYIIVL